MPKKGGKGFEKKKKDFSFLFEETKVHGTRGQRKKKPCQNRSLTAEREKVRDGLHLRKSFLRRSHKKTSAMKRKGRKLAPRPKGPTAKEKSRVDEEGGGGPWHQFSNPPGGVKSKGDATRGAIPREGTGGEKGDSVGDASVGKKSLKRRKGGVPMTRVVKGERRPEGIVGGGKRLNRKRAPPGARLPARKVHPLKQIGGETSLGPNGRDKNFLQDGRFNTYFLTLGKESESF